MGTSTNIVLENEISNAQGDCTSSPHYVSREVQTGISPKTSTCGLIEVSMDNMIYSFHCFYCNEIFPIWSWPQFVTHLKEYHDPKSKTSIKAENIYNDMLVFKTNNEMTDNASLDYSHVLENVARNEMSEFVLDDVNSDKWRNIGNIGENDGKSQENNITQVENLIASFIDSDFFASDIEEEDLSINKANQITFGKTDSSIVMDLLNLLKTYPILWHSPREPVYTFDSAVTEITKKINEKWSLSVTNFSMHKTLAHIREWYRCEINYNIVLDSEIFEDQAVCANKFPEYLEKCGEFLPKKDLTMSAKCQLPMQCHICKSYFCDEVQLRVHKILHHTAVKLSKTKRSRDPTKHCEICGKTFSLPSKYRMHKILHQPPRYKCRICSKTYHKKSLFVEHLKAHRNKRDYICDQCGKAFIRQRNMMQHKISVHSIIKQYCCNICGKRYRDFGGLYSHRKKLHLVLEGTIEELEKIPTKVHTKQKFIIDPITNIKRLICDICGNTFIHYQGLYAHNFKAHGIEQTSNRQISAHSSRKEMTVDSKNLLAETDQGTEFLVDDEQQFLNETENIFETELL